MSDRSRRVLLAAHPTVGHTTALRSIGRALLARGHSVAMALPVIRAPKRFAPEAARTSAAIPDAVRGDGIEVIGLSPALSSIWHALWVAKSTSYVELRHALGIFTAGLAGHARKVAAAAESWRADIVVADYLFFAGWLGARLAKRPFAAFYHSALPFPAAGSPPFGSDLANGAPVDDAWRDAERQLAALATTADARVAAAARKLGLSPPPARFLVRPYSEDLNLLATLPALEPGLAPLEGPVVFTGPCLGGRADESPDHPALAAVQGGAKCAYVSLGTVFNSNQAAFDVILGELDSLELRVIVSAGSSAEPLRKRLTNRNTHVFERVPQVALLQRVDVVITHGGNNTTQETLAAGKPMLVIPFGGDQLENARRIERLGAGLGLRPRQLSSSAVASAVRRLLVEPAFQREAQSAANALRTIDGTGRAVDAILSVLQASGAQARRG